MLYRYNEEFRLMRFIATYMQNGQEWVQHVAEKEELLAFQDAGHIKGLAFTEALYTEEQERRLEEVKNYPAQEYQTVTNYVLDNKVTPGTTLDARKQKETLEKNILEVAMIQGGYFK